MQRDLIKITITALTLLFLFFILIKRIFEEVDLASNVALISILLSILGVLISVLAQFKS